MLAEVTAEPPTAAIGSPQVPAYVELGDLPALRERGRLRLLAPRWEGEGLPREGLPAREMRAQAEHFAARLGLEPVWILVEGFGELIPALNAGRGDVIVTNLTVTEPRREAVAFSLPIESIEEVVLVSRDRGRLRDAAELDGLRFLVPRGSSYTLSLAQTGASVELAADDLGPDRILDAVIAGQADATLMDGNQARGLAHYRDDFEIAWTLPEPRNLAWAVRRDAKKLLGALNLFVSEVELTRPGERYREDLPGLKARRRLRVVMRNGPATYFLWKGQLVGFEYELVRWFARTQDLRLEVIVPTEDEDPLELLRAGRGDLVASAMTITPGRIARGFRFSRPYHSVHEVFVTGADAPPVDRLSALEGRRVVAARSSSYFESLSALQQRGAGFELVAAPPGLGTSEIVRGVASGRFDVTLADSHLVDIETRFSDDLVRGVALGDAVQHGWVVRREDEALLAAVDAFFERHYRGLDFNVIYNRYFRDERRIRSHAEQRITAQRALSPYDEIVRAIAPRYAFDWRLIVAQMYQESRFDPRASSPSGARGLLQVLPRTARTLGIEAADGLHEPEIGIAAGIRYLDWTRDRFAETLPVDERLWFSLAAYNAGPGHVHDARRLARQQGLDPDVWFDNVERSMLLLARREYASRARHGYVRGSEPVNYVQRIRQRYHGYVTHHRAATTPALP